MAGTTDGEVWEYILTNCPWARTKALWAPQADNLQNVLNRGSVREMHATLEYLALRRDFFHSLEEQGFNLRHVNHYEMASAQIWYLRIEDRLKASRASRLSNNGRKVVPEYTPKKVKHLWRN